MLERPNPAWWPADYMDEVMPPGRASPSDWIVAGADCPMLAPPDPRETPERPLRDGVIVSFISCEVHDEIDLTLNGDEHRFEHAPPAAFEQCCILDGLQAETLATTAEDMIALLRECVPGDDGEYRASFYTFNCATPYRFDAATNSFVLAASPLSPGEPEGEG